MITRGELRLAVLQKADAANPDGTASERWDTKPKGEVDRELSYVVNREWGRILNAQPDYRVSIRSVLSNADGRWAVADLSRPGERLYRVRCFFADGRLWREEPLAQNISAALGEDTTERYVWYRIGDEIATLPVLANTTAKLIVNHRPALVKDLADDSTEVPFPDGYEEILVYEGAAHLLTKGGAEVAAAGGFRALAIDMRDEMLQDLARFTTSPLHFGGPTDYATDWGG